MREQTFRCYLEFPLYALSIAISLTLPTILSRDDLINPSPTDPFCIPNSYPLNCTKDESLECHGIGGDCDKFVTSCILFIYLAFLTLVVTMSLILHSSFRDELRLVQQHTNRDNAMDDESIQTELIHQQKRAIKWQRIDVCYIFCTVHDLHADRKLHVINVKKCWTATRYSFKEYLVRAQDDLPAFARFLPSPNICASQSATASSI